MQQAKSPASPASDETLKSRDGGAAGEDSGNKNQNKKDDNGNKKGVDNEQGDEEDGLEWGVYLRTEEDSDRTKKEWEKEHKDWVDDQVKIEQVLLLRFDFPRGLKPPLLPGVSFFRFHLTFRSGSGCGLCWLASGSFRRPFHCDGSVLLRVTSLLLDLLGAQWTVGQC